MEAESSETPPPLALALIDGGSSSSGGKVGNKRIRSRLENTPPRNPVPTQEEEIERPNPQATLSYRNALFAIEAAQEAAESDSENEDNAMDDVDSDEEADWDIGGPFVKL